MEDINIAKIFTMRDAIWSLIGSGLAMYSCTFFTSFITLRLSTYGISDADMGYYLTIYLFPYLISAGGFGFFFGKAPRKLMFVISFFFSATSFLLMGPSHFFGLDRSLPMMLIGMCVLGFV